MEILDLRLLRSEDLEPLLEEEKVLWQDRLQWDYSTSAGMIKQFVDARALSGYAAVEAGRAVGYSFFIYEDSKGLIGDVFVSNSFRNGATEVRLLTHVIETMQGTPGIRRIEAQLMNFGNQPIYQCFVSQNFQGYDRKFMALRLDHGFTADATAPDEKPLPSARRAEVEVVAWDACWLPEAVRLIPRAYRGHVDSAISDQYRSDAGASRFLENIIHYPGCGIFQPDGSFLAVEKDSGRLCAMVLASRVGPGVGHITQLCVDPECQGSGMGTVLMGKALQRLQQRGFDAVTLSVTASNSKALRLYERLRFSPVRDFYAFVWDAPR